MGILIPVLLLCSSHGHILDVLVESLQPSILDLGISLSPLLSWLPLLVAVYIITYECFISRTENVRYVIFVHVSVSVWKTAPVFTF